MRKYHIEFKLNVVKSFLDEDGGVEFMPRTFKIGISIFELST